MEMCPGGGARARFSRCAEKPAFGAGLFNAAGSFAS